MERDFSWLWENLKEGAREKFEEICYDIYSNKYPDADVHRVKVTQGDRGIDIYIDEPTGVYTIVQCKFFLNQLNDGRKNQIRELFKTAVKKNKMDNWVYVFQWIFRPKSIPGGRNGRKNKRMKVYL